MAKLLQLYKPEALRSVVSIALQLTSYGSSRRLQTFSSDAWHPGVQSVDLVLKVTELMQLFTSTAGGNSCSFERHFMRRNINFGQFGSAKLATMRSTLQRWPEGVLECSRAAHLQYSIQPVNVPQDYHQGGSIADHPERGHMGLFRN